MAKDKKKSKEKGRITRAAKKEQSPWEILLAAIYSNDIESIRQVAATGFNLNGYNEYGYFPLYFATRNLDLMKCLAALGADVNAKVKNTSKQDGMTCLMTLASSEEKNNLREKMEILVQAGADVNAQDVNGWTSLHHAIKENEGSPESVEILLALGANPDISDADGCTPLVCAEGRLLIISDWWKKTPMPANVKKIRKMLLAAGAAQQNIDFLYLHKAVQDRDVKTVQSLIQRGVDLNRFWGSQCCLAAACSKGYSEIVEMLLAAGADPNLVRKGGDSPLIEAAREGHLEIVKCLLAAGADVGYRESLGNSAEEYARMNNHADVADYLRQCAHQRGMTPTRFGEGQGVISYELNETALVVKAGIDAVSKILKDVLNASVYESDVGRKRVTVTEECYYVMQFAGRAWTNIYEIKFLKKGGLSKELAQNISGKTSAPVLFYQNSDTAGAAEYFLFEQGLLIESVEADPEGWGKKKKKGKQNQDGLSVTSRLGDIAADNITNVYDFIRQRMEEFGILIPGFGYSMAPTGSQICFFESMAKEDFERVDFISR